MLTVDARCTHRNCSDAATGDIYRMVGRCSNCGQDGILVLFTAGHETGRVKCPTCRNDRVGNYVLATAEEIPAALYEQSIPNNAILDPEHTNPRMAT